MRDFFYRPEDGWAADFIPFYDEKAGVFRLYYLKDYRDVAARGEGTPWFQITTEDCAHFAELGQTLPRGTRNDQDLYVFTGSALYAEGKYHIFYMGHNPYFPAEGKPQEAILHAVSEDGVLYKKTDDAPIFAPDGYEKDDWRDPFVYFNKEEGRYHMLLAARRQGGPSRRRGVTALLTSPDLKNWSVEEPLYAPGMYFTHECPDLFEMEGKWYLLFSTFSDRLVTHYRISDTPRGPWRAPKDDQFDARAYYAAKTAEKDGVRYIFGWNPTRTGASDTGEWNWGGNLVAHELYAREDGTLAVRPPRAVAEALSTPHPLSQTPELGRWSGRTGASEGFAYLDLGMLPQRCRLEAEFRFSEGTRGCGFALHMDAARETGYFVGLDAVRGALCFDLWPRPGHIPYAVELDRPACLAPGRAHKLRLFMDKTVCVAYLDGAIAQCSRMYDHTGGSFGLYVLGGEAEYTNVRAYV